MTTREERTTVYFRVVVDLIAAATMDAYVERTAIAKAMDALGPVISDTNPDLVRMAIAFRNGPLLGDLHHPISTYLQKDPAPVTWSFEWEEVMRWDAIDISLRNNLIHTAHERAKAAGYLEGWDATWCGRVHDTVANGYFTVTLYPSYDASEFDDVIGEVGPKPKTPPGLLPTMLIEFGWVLGIINLAETVEQTISYYARDLLQDRKPDEFAKLTSDWWAKVEVTDIGYLVTFHYDREFP